MHLKKLILSYTNVTLKTEDQGNKYFRIKNNISIAV